ncbi:uncharacterized protein [Typha angustifolia]|uniref:uncharacterized protein n=1 Tax=Typha angustifolia TaxID=59011 RepID=UPI003C2FC53F
MSQVLSLPSALRTPLRVCRNALLVNPNPNPRWEALQKQFARKGRNSCFFSDGRKQEQAKKALESALGTKKTEFEKWNKEIERREQRDGGGGGGQGGWFGGRGWFGWFGGENFWEEAQQAILAIIGIVSLYLLIAKGNVMFAMVSNSLLFLLRRVRNWFTFLASRFPRRTMVPISGPGSTSVNDAYQTPMSAKERVVRKWGAD